MKSERRHELQHNQLADWLGELIVHAQRYSQAIVATIVGVAVIVGAYVFLSGRTARQEGVAWARYLAASDSSTTDGLESLTNLANLYPKMKGGQWARLTLADAQLNQGLEQLFNDRAAANLSLSNAVENYQRLRGQKPADDLLERVALGLGRAYEGLNKLNEARDEYGRLIKNYPNSLYVSEARQRLAALDREETRDFYDWFARQDLKPPAEQRAAGLPPGKKPSFDLKNLPAEGPLFEMNSPLKDSKNQTEAPAAEKAENKTEKPAADKASSDKPASGDADAEKASTDKPAEPK
jgi:hypothetical protein